MKNSAKNRIRFIGFFIVFVAVILLSKLYLVQVIQSEFFRERADRQHVRPGGSVFARGSISFEDKSSNLVNAATLKEGFILAISPRLLKDKEAAYQAVNSLYPIKREDFMSRAEKENDPYEVLASQVPISVGEKIDNLKMPGVILEKTRWRFYPGERLASHVLGFVGYQGDKKAGRYGLERYYNDVLSRDDSAVYMNFFSQIFSNIGNGIKQKDFGEEGNLVLTIEPTVQSFLTDELKKVMIDYQSENVGGIVINPTDGEIYAMAVLPDFNPNSFEKEKGTRVFGNPLIEDVFEMGSIIKPLTMAAGIDQGAVTAETTYTDKGYLILNNSRIENFDGKGRGLVDMQEVLNQSLNTGVAFVVTKMGKEKFSKYMLNYGLAEETGIDLPGEVVGLTENLKSTRDIEYATASYGQGVAFTPISTVRALSSLANGGKLITPHVVKEIRYKYGVTKKLSYGEGKQILKKETSDEITRMLVNVVDTALAQGKAKNQNYSVAAKTGTAQIAKDGGGGYYEDRFLHSFFGYFPAYKPKFLVFFYIINPRGVRYASETLTQPFLETSKFLINYYNIPPDR